MKAERWNICREEGQAKGANRNNEAGTWEKGINENKGCHTHMNMS